ncbi:SGNH/GDSL hydrolase family protein [Marmoricola sp. URHB0036]|uniref:SGNH/GDSL hydrolase family protein n=1 Tax=Marmoricola sp. URHB0036 TaxID=1298863 RepID=UPI000480CCEC|nr:SGNH/GDSL hydrolase family protein [Marmoricola sp. URHB0036]
MASRRGAALLTCLLSGLLLTGCSTSTAEGTQPSGSGDTALVPSAPPTSLRYVALGDSYVAAPLVPVTDVANGCFRSSSNYPSVVAKKLGAKLEDRSCAGASTKDFEQSQYPGIPPQLTALKPSTDVVTVGIGGNDEKVFGRLVGRCPALRASDPGGAPCQAAMDVSGKDSLLGALDRTGVVVTRLLRDVHQRSPKAQVLVVGYPQIVSATNACPELPLARGDYAYAERINLALTEMLRKAARASKSQYVDVWTASKGHDICSDDPWINGSVDNERQAARYHPFAKEQAAVADLVVRAIR